MKTRMIEVCNAIFICVLCEHNDSTDILCGGSPILGYDFYVRPDEDMEDLKKFIKGCLFKYNRPFLDIRTDIKEDFPVKNLWTREMMEECIWKNVF